MQFEDSETQRLLRSAARSFLAGARQAGDEPLTRELLREFAGLGWFRLVAPEAGGGGGASLLDAAVVIEELGYAGVAAPVAVANLAAALLTAAHERAGAERLLASVSSGDALCTVSQSTRRRAPRQDAGVLVSNGTLDGALPLVPFTQVCDTVLAPVALDGEPAFAALPVAAAGIEPVDVMDRRPYANVRFRQASTSDVVVLAAGHDAASLHERCDALSTALSLTEMAGAMQRVLEMTTEHIITRHQFGQPIAKFQAARHRAAELLMQVETTRRAAYHALWRFENEPSDTSEIWLTKHWAARAADRVFQIAHLLHGGVGVSMEHPLHRFTQAIASFAVRDGTMDEMASRTIEAVLAPAAAQTPR